MNPPLPPPPNWGGEREPLPLSVINQYLFCPRRAALIHLEGIFEDNEHTLRGDIVHEHTDLAGYEVAKGVLLWRALPVWSERLGLSGKCDIVEVHPLTPSLSSNEEEGVRRRGERSGIGGLFPVEFKLGRRRKWENDDAQLCAQALCLEEMFGMPVPAGAIFHADSKRRREVQFTPELRQRTEAAVAALQALFAAASSESRGVDPPPLPPAVLKPACRECSLYEVCLPGMTSRPPALARFSRALFDTDPV